MFDIPKNVKVLFVSGDRDSMCDLSRLKEVRGKMKCETWQLAVIGADHGMNVKPKIGTTNMGQMTGEIVAKWLAHVDHDTKEALIQWDPEESQVKWVGWVLTGSIHGGNPAVDYSATELRTPTEANFRGKQRETDNYDKLNASKPTKKRKTTDHQTTSKKSTKKTKRKQ